MALTKDWFVQTPPAIDTDASWPPFEEALQGALDSMVAMRFAKAPISDGICCPGPLS